MRQLKRVIEIWRGERNAPRVSFDALRHALTFYDRATSMRFYVNVVLFIETLRTQGQSKAAKDLIARCERGEVFGCFAMTELTHSSFLRGLQTVATYDQASDEYVIESTGGIGSTKWWIGGAGETATHAVVLAQLVLPTASSTPTSRGTAWFIVPIREESTGTLKAGVEAGHLGPKAGRDGLDSGFIRFHSVRVPSQNLLSKYVDLPQKKPSISDSAFSPSSPPTQSETPRMQYLAYNTLIGERLTALSEAASSSAQASIIATRYALVRRQGANNPQIIDYTVQYTTLLPILCTSIVVTTVHADLLPIWNNLISSSSVSPDSSSSRGGASVSLTPGVVADWHSTAASLKAMWTWWSLDSIERSRRTLGGHAFSAFNAVAGIWGDSGVLTTGGGDNYVLAQQCSSYLIKSYFKVSSPIEEKKLRGMAGKEAHTPTSLAYLKHASSLKNFGWTWPLEHLNSKGMDKLNVFERRELIVELLTAWRACIVRQLEALIVAHGSSRAQDWNEHMNELIELSNFHAFQLTLEVMIAKLERVWDDKHKSDFGPCSSSSSSSSSNASVNANSSENRETKPVREILADVILLHTLHFTTRESRYATIFLLHNVLTTAQMESLKRATQALAKKMRTNAARLTDAFSLPDFVLKSPLGRFDGDIYEPYFELVKRANTTRVTPYWSTVIEPTLRPHAKL